jgi:hypothetical protein
MPNSVVMGKTKPDGEACGTEGDTAQTVGIAQPRVCVERETQIKRWE